MFHKSLAKPLCFAFDVPDWWAWAWNPRDTQIILVELIAPLLALWTWRDFLKGRSCLVFNDSTVVESVLVRGYSNQATDINEVTGGFWEHSMDLELCVYIDRMPTGCNPSDGCSCCLGRKSFR